MGWKKFRKNKNVSKSGIIVKYVKEQGTNNQKIYTKGEFQTLKNYIRKEGKVFKTKKKLKNSCKHLIISPLHPSIVDDLNEKEMKEVEDLFVQSIFKTHLSKWGFEGVVEEKERDDKKHFHIHLLLNSSYDINLRNIEKLKKEVIENFVNLTFKKNPELLEKIGLKKDWRKYTINQKNFKQINWEKIKEINENIKELFNINKSINEIKDEIKNDLQKEKYEKIQYINFLNNNYLLIKVEFQFIEKIKEEKNELIREIKHTQEEFNYTFKNRKEEEIKNINEKLSDYKNFLENNDKEYFSYLKLQSSSYYIYLKYLYKNKNIDYWTFLRLLKQNKSYIKFLKDLKKKETQEKIRERKKELYNNLEQILKNLKTYKNLKIAIVRFKIKYKNEQIQKHIKNIKRFKDENEFYKNKIELKNNNINNYLKYINTINKYKIAIYQKIQKQKIEKEKELKKLNKQKQQQQIRKNKQQQQQTTQITTQNTQETTTTIYYDLGM